MELVLIPGRGHGVNDGKNCGPESKHQLFAVRDYRRYCNSEVHGGLAPHYRLKGWPPPYVAWIVGFQFDRSDLISTSLDKKICFECVKIITSLLAKIRVVTRKRRLRRPAG